MNLIVRYQASKGLGVCCMRLHKRATATLDGLLSTISKGGTAIAANSPFETAYNFEHPYHWAWLITSGLRTSQDDRKSKVANSCKMEELPNLRPPHRRKQNTYSLEIVNQPYSVENLY